MHRQIAKVSIGLPVYNGQNYLEQAIDGILNQTFKDLDIVICDNASTDGTEDICRAASARDSRIRYFRNPMNLGAAPNFNKCLHLAEAPYFKWAAHDDICLPSYVARCVEVLDAAPDVVACHSTTKVVDETGAMLRDYELESGIFDDPDPIARFANAISHRHGCITIFSVIRRGALLKTPGIDSYIGSDRTVLAQLALQGRIRHVQEPLFLSRDHSERSIRAISIRDRGEWFDAKRPDPGNSFYSRMLREYLRSLMRFPMSPWQRLRGFFALLYWVRCTGRNLIRESLPRLA